MRQLVLTLEARRRKAQAEAVTARVEVVHKVIDLFTGFGALKVGFLLAALTAWFEGKLPLL